MVFRLDYVCVVGFAGCLRLVLVGICVGFVVLVLGICCSLWVVILHAVLPATLGDALILILFNMCELCCFASWDLGLCGFCLLVVFLLFCFNDYCLDSTYAYCY